MGKNIIVRLAALACMASMLVGCTLVRVNPEKDSKLVVAVVNGEDVLKGDYLAAYEQQKIYLQYYGITDENMDDPEYKDTVKAFQDSILDALVTNKVVEQKAIAAGYTVTDEDLITAREDTIAQWADYLKSADESAGTETLSQEEYEQKAVDQLQEAADAQYITVEELIQKQAMADKVQAYQDEMLKDEVAGADEVEKYYQDNLASQQKDITTISSADVVLYDTPGVKAHYVRVKLNDEQQAEYDALENEGAQATYLEQNLKTKAEALKEEAEETDAEAMKEKYADDAQVSFVIDPYDMRKGGTYWDDSLVEALMNYSAGDVSDPQINEGAYYVFWIDEKLTEKVYTMDEKKQEIQDFLDGQKKDEKWTELTDQWKSESKIKTYKGRLK